MSAMPSNKAPKRYPIHQSPLYKILGKGQLENALFIKIGKLDRLLSIDNYRVWENDRGREIQQPIGWLAMVHKRIGELFGRIEVPDYVYSQRGRSYANNAQQHTGSTPLGKTDISKFYPSTTRDIVRQMFLREFHCARDIANILADLCCYQQKHLPTGSPISGLIAFFAARPMFDDIRKIATKSNSRMTVYVDDVTMSGSNVTKKLISDVRKVVRRHGLKTKQSKTKTFPAHAPKTVTGAVIVGDTLRLPNPRHRRIWKTRLELQSATGEVKQRLLRSLKGRLQEAKRILK